MALFCTYFDSAYLDKGLALCESLLAVDDDAALLVVACDDNVKRVIEGRGPRRLHVVSLADVESHFPALERARADRSRVEYFWTLTPFVLRFALDTSDAAEAIYVDADCYFFSSPSNEIADLRKDGILFVSHGFEHDPVRQQTYGRFNVGLVGFTRIPRSLEALAWWSARCLEWCYDRLEADRYGDQKYLDDIPRMFGPVSAVTNPGVVAAPWNVASMDVVRTGAGLQVGGRRLVMFHFHALSIFGRGWAIQRHGYAIPKAARRLVYSPYIRHIQSLRSTLRARGQHVGSAGRPSLRQLLSAAARRRLMWLHS